MKLHPTGNYLKAALWWVVAALLIAYQGVVAYRIVTTARWDASYLPMLWVGLLIVAFVLSSSCSMLLWWFTRESISLMYGSCAARPDDHTASEPSATARPLALREGEALALARTHSAGAIAATIARAASSSVTQSRGDRCP